MGWNRREVLEKTIAAFVAESSLGRKVARALSTGEGIVHLPASGKLIVGNDFHARHNDFRDWMRTANIVERLQNEDIYVLINGDVINRKPYDFESQEEGDSRILDEIRENQERFGRDRFIYTLGNHEAYCAEVFSGLPNDPYNRARRIRDLMNDRRRIEDDPMGRTFGAFYRQWNFLTRMRPSDVNYFNALPIAVTTENGIFCVHAGPSVSAQDLETVAAMEDEEVRDQLIWARPNRQKADVSPYEPYDVANFLRRMGDFSLMIVGHTPLERLNDGEVRNGIGLFGRRTVVSAPSYGCLYGQPQRFLELDLDRRYGSNRSLQVGREIKELQKAA